MQNNLTYCPDSDLFEIKTHAKLDRKEMLNKISNVEDQFTKSQLFNMRMENLTNKDLYDYYTNLLEQFDKENELIEIKNLYFVFNCLHKTIMTVHDLEEFKRYTRNHVCVNDNLNEVILKIKQTANDFTNSLQNLNVLPKYEQHVNVSRKYLEFIVSDKLYNVKKRRQFENDILELFKNLSQI